MTFNFRSGEQAAQASADRKAPSGSSKTEYFALKEGESTILRFLTDVDEIITVDQHFMVDTRPAPAGYNGKWPSVMSAVCRRDQAFSGVYSDCFICDHIAVNEKRYAPKPRGWALAAVREPVYENGQLAGFRDAVRNVPEVINGQETGKMVQEKVVQIVNMAFQNFFSHVFGYANMASNGGTILNRDYEIRRTGAGLDTKYTISGLDKITLEDGRPYDLRDPEILARYRPFPSLEEILTDRSSDDYYHRFFDTRFPQPNGKSGEQSSPTQEPPKAPVTDAPPAMAQPSAATPYSDAAQAILARVQGR